MSGISELLCEKLIITVQCAIDKLGPMPDNCGASVKKILSGSDEIAFLSCGCYIQDCDKSGSWSGLREGLDRIEDHQKRQGKNND
jgi:hypothetical protein